MSDKPTTFWPKRDEDGRHVATINGAKTNANVYCFACNDTGYIGAIRACSTPILFTPCRSCNYTGTAFYL